MDKQYQEAYENLVSLTECRCDPAWTDRDLHHPECRSDYRIDVELMLAAVYGGK